MPDPATISNSSGLIALDAIGRIDLLRQMYGTILIPPAVAQECGSAIASWMRIQPVQNQGMVQSLRINLGAGEAEAIGLAAEVPTARVILDDKKARRIARQLGVPVTGLLAVLLQAKQRGLISSLREIIAELSAAQFFLSDALADEALCQAGESTP